MTLTLIKNKEIRSNKRKLDTFLENFHENFKEFTIDCQSLNVDFFNSDTIVRVRHRKPIKDSIYYAETYKDHNEVAYFFGLGRENTIATSSYLNRGAQLKPILVATLNIEDSSKSNLVFAKDSNEYNNVLLLKIDCNGLTNLELKVLKDKNKISQLDDGKGYINFGAIGDFSTLTNIRNFISNVKFSYENVPFIKLTEVSIPEVYNTSKIRPDDTIVRDRFINFGKVSLPGEEVIDSNEIKDEDVLKTSLEDNSVQSGLNTAIDDLNDILMELNSADDEVDDSEGLGLDELSSVDDEVDDSDAIDFNNLINDSSSDDENPESKLYKIFSIDENSVYFELSIYRNDFFDSIIFIKNIVDLCGSDIELDLIEVIDMGDDILNMSINIHVDENTLDLINRILIKNGFTPIK